jgi:Na+-translocating ferredoxin:NAD+ oxidoreductase RnfD subunit
MSAPAHAAAGRPNLRIRGTHYPVLLPSIRDPRLHLAAVIVSLQILGQVAFEFDLSIAQIIVALLTCAVLEVAIAFRQQRVILWPASALLTGNGVAFILRVPGTEHGDWWSLNGWWIFAGAAAVGLLSKHLIKLGGRHLFNPSNFGLVLCFLVLGADQAEPLDFWWAPMSAWMLLALAIIVAGGFAILARLRLLAIAVGFWLAFAAGIGVLAATGHEMTARWHLGPVTGWDFWWALVSSPEILVFLFFMITDPKTIPAGPQARRAYGVGVGLLATILIAPLETEYATKVAVLGSLALMCAARPVVERLFPAAAPGELAGWSARRRVVLGTALTLAVGVGFAGALVLAGIPTHADNRVAAAPAIGALPEVSVLPSRGVASTVDRATALQIARHVVADLGLTRDALRRRDASRATLGVGGSWLASLAGQIEAADGGEIVVPDYRCERMRVSLERGDGQGPPIVVAALEGTVVLETYGGSPTSVARRGDPTRFEQTLELALTDGRYKIVRSRSATGVPSTVRAGGTAMTGLGAVRLTDIARQVGLDFRHGAFRAGVTRDPTAMMGGGVCWLDYDADGWLDLFAVNSYSDEDPAIARLGGLPRAALFHNVRGRFEDVSRGSGADLQLRGNGCVAADLNQDGRTDLFVTSAGYNAVGDRYDALLWNNGDGTFTEGARAAGVVAPGWHAGAAVADVNGDGRPDLFVAGYTDVNAPIASSTAGFPSNYGAVRDLLYLNEGPDGNGRSTFREVGLRAGIEARRVDHGLGATFTDVDGDGRLDLYVANDLDPNRLYMNSAGGRLGFRLEERGRREGVADPNAGMGIAAGDYNADGRADLFVTNSRGQLHSVYRTQPEGRAFADARLDFVPATGSRFTGWGVSWADLDNDARLDLVLANGAIPVTSLARNAETLQVLGRRADGSFANAGLTLGPGGGERVNGRGLAAADYDNDGDLDVAVGTIGGRLMLLRNSGAKGHWLEVALPAFSPGAVVTAVLPDGRRLVREVRAGSSYLSSEDPRVHFGLGGATSVRELVVRYPGGGVARLENVPADRLIEAPRP